MDSISLWNSAPVVTLLALIIVIATADGRKTLTRKDYAIRSVTTLILMVLGLGISLMLPGEGAPVLFYLLLAVAAVLQVLWSVHRTQDLGWSRWWNLLHMVQPAGLIWWIILMTKKRSASNDRADQQSAPSA
jgi:uncharacterized membrane protein YhaH (DUF805 family)